MPRTYDGRHALNRTGDAGFDYDPGHPLYNYSKTGDLDYLGSGGSSGDGLHPCADVSDSDELDDISKDCIDWYINEYGNFNETQTDTALVEVIPVGIIYGLTLLLGVVGNTLVIVAIARNRRMQTVTNAFLTSLASADLLLVLLCVPIKLMKFISFTWTFGEVLCKMVHYMQNVSVICSILTLTAMSMERYYAILHPMKAKFSCTPSRAKRVICVLWLLSVLLAVPIVYGQIHQRVGLLTKAYWCIKEWPDQSYSIAYEVGMLLLIFVFPLIIITVAYVNICRELWHMTKLRQSLRAGESLEKPSQTTNGYKDSRNVFVRRKPKASSEDDKTRKQVIKMLVTVILLFVICWGPLLIDNVLKAVGVAETLNYDHLKPMRQAFSLMAYFNSCVNPIVYAFMSRNFRDSFRQTICVCSRKDRRHKSRQSARQSSFNTRTSTVSMSRGASVKYELCPHPTAAAAQNSIPPKKHLVQYLPETEVEFSESETGV